MGREFYTISPTISIDGIWSENVAAKNNTTSEDAFFLTITEYILLCGGSSVVGQSKCVDALWKLESEVQPLAEKITCWYTCSRYFPALHIPT